MVRAISRPILESFPVLPINITLAATFYVSQDYASFSKSQNSHASDGKISATPYDLPTHNGEDPLKKVMLTVRGGSEEALKIYELKNLNQAIKDLMIFKLTHPETEKPHGR